MKKTYPYLTYAGALPFILCAACMVFDISSLPLLGEVKQILSIYTLLIASFMAGSHWGQHLHLEPRWATYLSLSSNLVAISLWLSFLVLPFAAFIITGSLIFTILLAIDAVLKRNRSIISEYFKTRCTVTIVVVASLIISVIFV